MAWTTRFEIPVSAPGRQLLLTLKEAADYIQKLPIAEQETPEWQAAIQALILAAEDKAPLLHARVGMLRALNRNLPQTFSDRKPTNWGKRKLKRDE